ncbi:MAG: Outer membrane efflux protein BepC [Alphaproteobacteria bacterium MarineAlpha2_Bin1]|nr:MAG: Outer membrane efflux protein BepC [Alphaproteobacteria bacterium MarineAlpha2_Bin1]
MIKKYINSFFKIIFIYCLSKIIFINSVNAESLSDVAKIAVPNHPSIIAQKQLLKAAKIGVREAKAGYLPTVDMRLGGSRARTNSSTTRGRTTRPTDRSSQSKVLTRKEGSLTVSQMIFDGFATKNLVGAAASRFELANEQILEIAQGVSLRLSAAYVGVARDRTLLSLAEKNIKRHADIIEQIQVQVESGGATAADLDQARARIEGAKAIYMQMGGRLRDSEAGYLEAVGSLPGNIIFPKPDNEIFGFSENNNTNSENKDKPQSLVQTSDEYNSALEKILDLAMQNNHALNSARLTIDSVMSTRKAAKSPFLPRVDLQLLGSRTQNVGGSPGMSSDHVATFNFTYNFYRGGGDTARLESSKASLAESRARLMEAKRLIEQTLRISFNAWNTARSQLPSLESRVEASQAALDSYKEQFTLGKRTLLEVLNAENEVFGARSALAEGRSTVLLAQFQVLAATGTLTNYLGIDIFGDGKNIPNENKVNNPAEFEKIKSANNITKETKNLAKVGDKEKIIEIKKELNQKSKLDSEKKTKPDLAEPINISKKQKKTLDNNLIEKTTSKIEPVEDVDKEEKELKVAQKILSPRYVKKDYFTKNINNKGNIKNIVKYSMVKKPGIINKIIKPINLVKTKDLSNVKNLIQTNYNHFILLKPTAYKESKKLIKKSKIYEISKKSDNRKIEKIFKTKKNENIQSRKILNQDLTKKESKLLIKGKIESIIEKRPGSINVLERSKILFQDKNDKILTKKFEKPPVFLPGEPS